MQTLTAQGIADRYETLVDRLRVENPDGLGWGVLEDIFEVDDLFTDVDETVYEVRLSGPSASSFTIEAGAELNVEEI